MPKIPLTSGSWPGMLERDSACVKAQFIPSEKNWIMLKKKKKGKPDWSKHFGNSRFHSAMAISSFILLGTIAIQHQAKPSSLSPRSLFPGVHLSTLSCASFHVAPSYQQVFNRHQWFSITSFIAYFTQKPSLHPYKFSFWQTIASGMTHCKFRLLPSWLSHPTAEWQSPAPVVQWCSDAVMEGLVPPSLRSSRWLWACNVKGAAESQRSSSLLHITRVYSSSSTLSLWHIMTILCWIASAPSLITIELLIKI